MTRHFLSVGDLSPAEVHDVLDLAEKPLPLLLSGAGVALVFEHPSARTRNAFELAVVQLGGHPVAIHSDEIGIDTREDAEDVARTLACYHRVLAARVHEHTTLERMVAALGASGVEVPVVNLLSDREHPTQALADLLTIRQVVGALEGVVVAYIGDCNNVCRSLMAAAALTGITLRVSAPAGYGPSAEDLRGASAAVGSIVNCEDPREAASEADVLYTDVWVSMGQSEESEARRGAFVGFGIDEELRRLASPNAVVMHCLPAHRGEEITAAVLDGPASVVWQQAANRMHAARGLLAFLCGAGEASAR